MKSELRKQNLLKRSLFLKLVSGLLLPTLFTIATLAGGGEPQGYDEIFDNEGQVRAEYNEIYPAYENAPDKYQQNFLRESRRAFQKDNRLHPFPRVVSAKEYDEVLRKGVEQRGRAIQMFLRDHYSGQKKYLKAGIISEADINRIILRHHEDNPNLDIDPKAISFLYGPDLFRAENGEWYAFEDNSGFLGGLGDLKLAYDFMMENFPSLPELVKARHPNEFYDTLVERYKRLAKQHNGGRVVLYLMPPYPDNEDYRVKKLFAERGVVVVTQNTKAQLEIEGSQVYVRADRNSRRERVGFVAMIGEHWWLDPSYLTEEMITAKSAESLVDADDLPGAYRRELRRALRDIDPVTQLPQLARLKEVLSRSPYLSEATQMRKQARQARGLTALIAEGKMPSNYSPGIDFHNDKEFYTYVEDLVRFYLKEEPIVKNIPTRRFLDGAGRLNSRLVNKVFGNFKDYVVKKVDGRGGVGVWIGRKLPQKKWAEVQKIVEASPASYIVQKYMPLSYVEDYIVDMRIFADIGPDSIYVAPMGWSRGVSKAGNGKVNISSHGLEFTVLVEEESPKAACARELTK